MLRNYLKTAVRNLWRRKGYSAINVLGLSLGLACCLVIALFVQDEMSFDRHHADGESIYRVSQDVRRPGEEERWAWTGGGLLEDLQEDFPEQLEISARMLPSQGVFSWQGPGGSVVSLREENFGFVDPAWLELFSYPFLKGNPQTALENPNSVILTESTARRYFGDTDPLGQVLQFNGSLDLTVTGILEDRSANSHIAEASMVVPATSRMK